MTAFQKVIKYLAIALAVFLTVSIISGVLGAVGLFGGLFGEDGILDDLKTYSVSDNFTELEIEVAAADFTIKQADVFTVESNLKNLSVTEKDGVLVIKEKKRFGIKYTDATLVLNIPAETVFKKVNIIAGAGRLTVDTLSADYLKLELGAGEVNIKSLIAKATTEIMGGAGKITISDGALHSLDLDMGVGQLNMTSALTGNSDLDLGVGESNLTFIGSEADYAVDIEKGIGSITVDGKNVSNYTTTSSHNKIDIDGGVGAINVVFKPSSEA